MIDIPCKCSSEAELRLLFRMQLTPFYYYHNFCTKYTVFSLLGWKVRKRIRRSRGLTKNGGQAKAADGEEGKIYITESREGHKSLSTSCEVRREPGEIDLVLYLLPVDQI